MKLLHLEDNDSDAELAAAVICREWPDCEITRLCTAREFKASLQVENFDLVLSDYTMPGFDGLSALEIVRATCPDTPFVFLSGTIGEERAIEAMRHGATDYVLKDAPGRLLTAVRGAMRQTQRESARRRAEESLRKSREQFQQIAETIEDFIVLIDERGTCLYANPAFRKLLRCTQSSVGSSIFEYVHPGDLDRLRTFLRNVGRPGGQREIGYRLVLLDGGTRHLEARASLPPNSQLEPPSVLLAGRDVTERKIAEEKLLEQASLLGKARDAIFLLNLEFKIMHWNASAERIFGLSSCVAVGSCCRQLLFGQQTARFDTAFALTLAHGEWNGEFRLTRADGQDLVLDSSWTLVNDAQGRPKSILCIDTDVTGRKQLEMELQRSQRIEGLGMLAGGIAHDLNNVLSPILMSVGLLRHLATTPEDRQVIDTLEASASHGTDLVRQILLFARGGGGQRTEVRLEILLDELESFLKTSLRREIDLYLEHDDDLWSVFADATQLKQVIMNLCVNARDAMVSGGGIRISAVNVRVEPGAAHGFHGEIPAGPHVRLSVADTGVGIPEEIYDKIFDPFFTTKELGKGTGLGLSTIAGIVQNHGGAIQVESVIGEGTTFHIYLPAMADLSPPASLAAGADVPGGRGEVVLIIDDDDGIRLVAGKILESRGYEVCTAADGRSGLEEFARQRSRIGLVLCDQVMPGMKGSDVLEQIHETAPEVKLIAMSGLFEDGDAAAPAAHPYILNLPKPLKTDSLLRLVHEAFAAPSA